SVGYRQSIIVSTPLEREARERALLSAQSRWPFARRPRQSNTYSDRLLLALPELTDHLFDRDEDRETVIGQNSRIESELSAWSREFPAAVFAYVEAECFGGICEYSGFACRGDAVIERVDLSDDAHVRLLRHVGIVTDGVFEPFTRAYFEGRSSGLRT